MGSIKRQSISSTIISYLGVVIGFVSSAILMPLVFLPSQIGFIKLIFAALGIFSSIFSLGVFQLQFRLYPQLSHDQKKLNYLFYYSLRISLIGTLLAAPFFIYFSGDLLNINKLTEGIDKSNLLIVIVFIAIFARLIYNSFLGYIRMMGDIIVDALLQNIVLKGGLLLFIILFYFDYITFSDYIYLLLSLYILYPVLALIYMKFQLYLPAYIKGFRFDKHEIVETTRLATFGTLSTIGGTIYLYLDTLMINEYLGEAEVGIYGTMFLFGIIINIPARGLKSVSQSVLSHAIESGDIDKVKVVYQKSSATLFALGGLIFLGVWSNLYSVFSYLPVEFLDSELVVLFISIAQLIDMSFGVNSEIINGSPHYKLNTFFIFLSIIFAVLANVMLIPLYGVNGAAFATLLAFLSVNIVRMIAIYHFYKIQPFSFKTLYNLLLIIGVAIIMGIIPNFDHYIINLFWKGFLVLLIYIPSIYFLNLSEDLKDIIDKLLKRVKIK